MKKTLLFILTISLLSSFLHAQVNCDYQDWDKVYLKGATFNCTPYQTEFIDNFSGTEINSNFWNTFYFDENHEFSRIHTSDEEQIYLDENVTVNNGTCKLKGMYAPNSTWISPNGTLHQRDYTSGVITSKQSFRYGRFDVRIKISKVGWWPSFWLYHHDEVDIMENFSNDEGFSYNLYSDDDYDCNTKEDFDAGELLYNEFHTYSVDITPFTLTYYFDGQALPIKYYRYYDLNGNPLDINCNNNQIPEGHYLINPLFPEIGEEDLL